MAPPRSPLRGRYLVQNRVWNAVLRASDATLTALVRPRPASGVGARPRRLLLAVGGHLGDAVIATSVLPLLARHLPDVQIGMVLPSWSERVVRGHPRLEWIHTIDHWKLSRSGLPFSNRLRRYLTSSRRALAEMRTVGYDAAVDLYAYYPNTAATLWRADIPHRYGYTSGGFGPLFTRALDWTTDLGHTAEQHLRLLTVMDAALDSGPSPELRYDLPPLSSEVVATVDTVLSEHGLRRGEFVVLHAGTGEPKKAWPIERWRHVVRECATLGVRVVLTGAGTAERAAAAAISADASGVVDLVDRLEWEQFRGVVAAARLLVGIDSVAVHVAAAEGTPCIAIMSAISEVAWWGPLTHDVSVPECRAETGVSVEDVLRAMRERLNRKAHAER